MSAEEKKTIIVSLLQEVREEKKLTQKFVADHIKVSESTIANWENGRTGAETFAKLDRLCNLLDVQLCNLYKETVDSGIDLGNPILIEIEKLMVYAKDRRKEFGDRLASFLSENYATLKTNVIPKPAKVLNSIGGFLKGGDMFDLTSRPATRGGITREPKNRSDESSIDEAAKAEISEMIDDLAWKITERIMEHYKNLG